MKISKVFRLVYFCPKQLALLPLSLAFPSLRAILGDPWPLLGFPSAVGISMLAWRPMASSLVARAWRQVSRVVESEGVMSEKPPNRQPQLPDAQKTPFFSSISSEPEPSGGR